MYDDRDRHVRAAGGRSDQHRGATDDQTREARHRSKQK
jgi:hypothetical protein